MSGFMWVVNHVDKGYGVNTPLNAKEIKQHTFTIMKEWPSVIEKFHLEDIHNSELGYGLKEKISTRHHGKLLRIFLNGIFHLGMLKMM